MCGEVRLEADRLLGEGKKRVDLAEYPELAWQLFWIHRDPIMVKAVNDRLEELKDSLCKKREMMKEADDPCRMARRIAQSTIEQSEGLVFFEPPSTKDMACFRVIEAAQDCPSEMCRDLVRFALEAEIHAIGLTQNEINDGEDSKSDFFERELKGYDTASLVRVSYGDFFNNLDEGEYEVDLKDRHVLSWGTTL